MHHPFTAGLAVVLASVGAIASAAPQQMGPEQVFAARESELPAVGVRSFDGYTFATVISDGDRRGPGSSSAALRAMLEDRMHATLPTLELKPSLGRAAAFAAVGCVEGQVDLAGMVRVSQRRTPEGALRVVHAIPTARIEVVEMRLPQLVQCIDRRLVSGRASVADVLLMGELAPEAQVPGALVRSLAAICGDGIASTASQSWLRQGGLPLAQGIRGWGDAISASVRATGTFGPGLRPMDGMATSQIDDPEEAIRLLGTRANDPALLSRATELLRSLGWERCAAQLPTTTGTLTPAMDRAGSRLPREVRASLASSAPVATLLLTDGSCPIALAPGVGPNYERARVRFNEGTGDGFIATASLLAPDFGATPRVEDGVLLAMSLLSLSDPGLAAPIARACFRCAPDHPHAGVTMLIALRQSGANDAMKLLLPQVEASARVDAWGAAQLESIRRDCGLAKRVVPNPVPVHAGGDDEP